MQHWLIIPQPVTARSCLQATGGPLPQVSLASFSELLRRMVASSLLAIFLFCFCRLFAAGVDSFSKERKPFCLSQVGSVTVRSDLDCSRSCVRQPVCCGFTFDAASGRCSLLQGVPTNVAPSNAAPGSCMIFMRKRCRPCPAHFNMSLPSAPKRRFYMSRTVKKVDTVRSYCEAEGGAVSEIYPASVFGDFVEEAKKVFVPSVVLNQKLSCRFWNGAFCHLPIGASYDANGNFYWPNRKVTVAPEYYRNSGIDVITPAKKYYFISYIANKTTGVFIRAAIDTSYTTKPIVCICECTFFID